MFLSFTLDDIADLFKLESSDLDLFLFLETVVSIIGAKSIYTFLQQG
jgi:hypothetical protein